MKWCKIIIPIKKGGLGVKDLRKMNLSLLCKWWWKIETGQDLWQEIVQKKYIGTKTLWQLKKKPMNSSAWNDLIKVRDLYVKRTVMLIGDGKKLITGMMPGVSMSL